MFLVAVSRVLLLDRTVIELKAPTPVGVFLPATLKPIKPTAYLKYEERRDQEMSFRLLASWFVLILFRF